MKIKGKENEQIILKEIGHRIKQLRISHNMTQVELAEKCGISSSTEARIENGEDSKLSNYLKIFSELNILENIDLLIPEQQPDFKSIYEKKPSRKRVKANHSKSTSNWVWGEDRKDKTWK